MKPNLSNIITESTSDLIEDYQELLYLVKKPIFLLEKFGKISSNTNHLLDSCKDTKEEIASALNTFRKIKLTENEVINFIILKKSTKQKLRNIYQQMSGALMINEYQSPSFIKTDHASKINFSGKIKNTINDYKRDQHHIGQKYEKLFEKNYLNNSLQLYKSYITGSGMSAFTTILALLKSKDCKVALMGERSYFQLKELAEIYFYKVIYFDENNFSQLKSLIKNHKPDCLFADSMSNDQEVEPINLEKIIEASWISLKKIYLIIDNTVQSTSIPINKLFKLKGKNSLILFESLNKHHQYGFDLVAGGIIYSKPKVMHDLFYIRMHSGTNIPDHSAFILPNPNKIILHNRLQRISRNAMLLSKIFRKLPEVSSVSYPIYPKKSFSAPFFSINLKKKYNSPSIMNKFCNRIYRLSKSKNIDLIGGSSFGLDTSRLYLTALRAEKTIPFIRFSPGIETIYEINSYYKLL